MRPGVAARYSLAGQRAAWQARVVELLTAGVRPSVPRQTVTLAENVEMTFSYIPPGTFLMGSPASEEGRGRNKTQHKVTLTQGFWMAVTHVTQAQWTAVMGDNPSFSRGQRRPVECVTWEECQAFCRALSERKGKQFRLPTEAQWEYACRSGTTTPFFWGQTLTTEQANYHSGYPYGEGAKGLYRKQTTSVGRFPCNAWGLHEMHGNIDAWCQDWFGEVDCEGPAQDPQGPIIGDYRVVRGGCWDCYADGCRAAYRARLAPDTRSKSVCVGCRPVSGMG